jgi:hypothetical protein
MVEALFLLLSTLKAGLRSQTELALENLTPKGLLIRKTKFQ